MRSWLKHLGLAALAAAFAIGQFRMIANFLQQDYGRSVEAAKGVVTGYPHWRVFQNRVLGPYIVEGLSNVFPSFLDAHVFYSIATLALCGYLIIVLTRAIHGNLMPAFLAFFAFHALFTLLLGRPWLYAWDYLGMIFFVLFNYFVLDRKPWFYFALLFAVSVFSRESASFFAVWMLAQPVIAAGVGWLMRERPLRFDFRLFGAGLLCLLLGGAIVEELRSRLLVREVGPEIFADAPADAGKYFHFELWHNLDFIGRILTTFSYGMEVAILLFLVGVVVLAVVLGLSNPRRCLALGLTHVALVASLLTFGVFQETRIYLELIPFVAMGLGVLLADGAVAARPASVSSAARRSLLVAPRNPAIAAGQEPRYDKISH